MNKRKKNLKKIKKRGFAKKKKNRKNIRESQ